MSDKTTEQAMIAWLTRWAETHEDVRACILTSSRVSPNAPVDIFSDYDVEMFVTDIHPYFRDKSYLEDYGPVLVVFRNPIRNFDGFDQFADITQYTDGMKIDWAFIPTGWLEWAVQQPELPEDFDLGYRVLVDKDHLTDGLKPPTHRAYIPMPPSWEEYYKIIEDFFSETPYVAKHLWRGDLIAAKYNLDYEMKFVDLRKILEWRMEIDNKWSVKPGSYGRGLGKRTRPDLWAALEETYVGASWEDNWTGLFRTIDLFRKVAQEVGEALGYSYPIDLDQRVVAYLHRAKNLPRDAQSLDAVRETEAA